MSRESRREKQRNRGARRRAIAARRPHLVRAARAAWSPGNRLLTTAAAALSLGMAYAACTCGHGGNGEDLAPLPGTVFYIHDHLGGPTVLTDTEGRVVGEEARDVWGKKVAGTDEPRQFADAEFDDEAGLYYMGGARGGRYYDPVAARFLSVDPAVLRPYHHTASAAATSDSNNRATGIVDPTRDPQVLNPYSYARNSPASYYDPSGEEVKPIVERKGPTEIAKKALDGKTQDPRALGFTQPWVTKLGCDASCSKRADRTFGFDARPKVEIRVDIAKGRSDDLSEQESGRTIKQHEMGHAEDLMHHFGKQQINKAIKTEGFDTQLSCESARAQFRDDLQKYTNSGSLQSHDKRGDFDDIKARGAIQPPIDGLQQP